MFPRALASVLEDRFRHYPIVTVTGPRQAGKTTLCRATFDLPYASLEDPETREAALGDPRAFLGRHTGGAILDEVQRAPDLLSYLQGIVDDRRDNGLFVLTGSHNFTLHSAISQSLAGRTAVLDLLALDELRRFPHPPSTLFATLRFGGYPRIHDQGIPPGEFLADYVRTYVERDVRTVLNIGDLNSFQTFLRLAAGRTGQLLNLTALAADAGITHKTAKAWISVLETSYLVIRLQPWHRNLGKRLVKTPKLYFLDSGLLCYLLGIRTDEQLGTHPLRGPIFETWVVSEVLKARWNAGVPDPIYFFRDRAGMEVDLVIENSDRTVAVEIKSGTRVATDALQPLDALQGLVERDPLVTRPLAPVVVYGGEERTHRRDVEMLPWSEIDTLLWAPGQG